MNGYIIAGIVIIAVLAAVALVGVAGRRDTGEATGKLARETVSRDRKARKSEESLVVAGPSGREVERSVALARTGGGAVEAAPSKPPTMWVPPDPESYGVTRRQFLNRSVIVGFILGLSSFGAAVIAFLWPSGGGGFGSKIRVGKVGDIKAEIAKSGGFLYKPEGRMWITEFPAAALPKAKAVYSPSELNGMESGLIALYQKCPHLGCRVPECKSSQWFECPCHGSFYNRVGEKKAGPAPRGMDRFGMSIEGDTFVVDTGNVISGPAIGVNTTGQEAEGPHCKGDGGH